MLEYLVVFRYPDEAATAGETNYQMLFLNTVVHIFFAVFDKKASLFVLNTILFMSRDRPARYSENDRFSCYDYTDYRVSSQ